MFAPYMLNTWEAGSLIALPAGLVGFFAVLRGESFASHALPLGTFPGAAFAAWAGINTYYGLVGFALLGIILINQLAKQQHQPGLDQEPRSQRREDTHRARFLRGKAGYAEHASD